MFVRTGNPHCVTVLPDTAALPGIEALRASALHARLASIAYAAPAQGNVGARGTGDPCPSGVNLRWAAPASRARIMARVFARGEGPTASSGTSATAIACAFWRLGFVGAGRVEVEMPGGTAPLALVENDGQLSQMRLLGMATPCPHPG